MHAHGASPRGGVPGGARGPQARAFASQVPPGARVPRHPPSASRPGPHEGGRISGGPLIDGKHVLCPLHNYRFDPATGKAVGVSCPDARTYKIEEQAGDCEVWA